LPVQTVGTFPEEDPESEAFWQFSAIRASRCKTFGKAFRVWALMLDATKNRAGMVEITQAELGRRADLSEKTIRTFYRQFEEDGLLEKRRNSAGRIKFYITPEAFWNRRLVIRNREVKTRRKAA